MAEGCLLATAEPAALLRAETQRAREAAAATERTRVTERRQLVERYEALLGEGAAAGQDAPRRRASGARGRRAHCVSARRDGAGRGAAAGRPR